MLSGHVARVCGALVAPPPLHFGRGARGADTDRRAVQEIVKLGYSGDSADGDGVSATNMLTGNYAQSAMPTPMRTPRAEARGGDTILQDALDLKALQETVTPLKVWPHSGCRNKHCVPQGLQRRTTYLRASYLEQHGALRPHGRHAVVRNAAHRNRNRTRL